LTVLFQRFVHRRPLWRAWVPTGPCPRPDVAGVSFGLALAALPLACLLLPGWIRSSASTPQDPRLDAMAWLVAAAVGGLVAGVVVRRQPAAAWRRSASYTVMGILCGMLVFTVGAWQGGRVDHLLHPHDHAAAFLLGTSVLYFDVSFVLEEVTFRGVIDPYLLGDSPGQSAQYMSALASSALWGAWHVPLLMASGSPGVVAIVRVVLTHASLGLVFCFAVRSAGTLVPGALAHAFSDAYRNLLT
jgi:hypothetical protein